MERLRLFVVGEHSADPNEWGGNHAFVVAADAAQAERLAMDAPAIELPMNEPVVLGYENVGYEDD